MTIEKPTLQVAMERFNEAATVWVERAVKLIQNMDPANEGPPLSKSLESWDGYPRDPDDPMFCNANGQIMGGAFGGAMLNPCELTVPYMFETELTEIRRYCRWLAKANPFAECCHANRISYVIGEGFVYRVTPKEGEEVSNADKKTVQDVLNEWLKVNKWAHRSQEIMLRGDRDGETFLRKFGNSDGIQRVRFVEPRAVRAPGTGEEHKSFGVETDPEDTETVVAYWIGADHSAEPDRIPADQIQHRKRNVDSSCKRGMPILFGVRGHMLRPVKNLRNISSASGIQTAIGMIRKHMQATQSTVTKFVTANATQPVQTNPVTGQPQYTRQYEPGTVLDAPAGMEYEFPATGIDPEKHIAAVQGELRAAAAALIMPEFMFTADASNANFASTMVAEGPCVKNMKRLQWYEVEDDRELIMDALEYAAGAGLLSADLLERITIDIQPPPVQVRDRLKDAQTAQILLTEKIVSPQTVAGENGYDYDHEQENIEDHNEKYGVPPGSVPLPGLPGLPGQKQPIDPNADPTKIPPSADDPKNDPAKKPEPKAAA